MLRGTCTSRQLLLRCSTFLLPGRSQVQWRKCNRIVGRFCASRQLLLDRCSRRGSNSATAPCVALPPASLQSSSVHGVVHCSNFRHPGNRSCITLLSYVRVGHQSVACAGGISASMHIRTIPAMHVRTILAKCPIWEIYGSIRLISASRPPGTSPIYRMTNVFLATT